MRFIAKYLISIIVGAYLATQEKIISWEYLVLVLLYAILLAIHDWGMSNDYPH